MVSVKKTEINNKIRVKTNQETNVFSIKDNLSEYYAKLAERWANSPDMVNGIDYSSKYYAEQSKASAQNAEDIKTEITGYIEGFDTRVQEANDSIDQNSANAINALDNAYTVVSGEIRTQAEEAIGDLTQTIDNSIAEYTEISNQIKQDNSKASKLAKDWATSEVIVDNIDYSAKYYAEKAKDNSGIFYDELTDKDIDVEIISGGYVTKADLELGLDTKQDKGDYALRNEIPDITPLATKQELTQGLNAKQPKGNYALVEDIPTQVSELANDSNYATQTQVLQAIASIPQFKLSIVEALPTTGEKMTLYLVPKEGTNNDVYNEYIWIEQTSSFEHLGSTAVDLTDYVKNTDYANSSSGGVVRVQNGSHGLSVSSYGILTIQKAMDSQIISKGSNHAPLVTANIDLAVKTGVTTNTIELTDAEKANACNWLGTSKTVLTTEADYNALTTKDANTLYLIEE